jgi:hypothetical protein
LEYQRQLHLQHLAGQEAEMQARLDQQRRYTQQREQQNQVNSFEIISKHKKNTLIRCHTIHHCQSVIISQFLPNSQWDVS